MIRFLKTLIFGYQNLRRKEQEHAWQVGNKTIPDDVRKRAEKGGRTKPPDWYAGR